MSMYNTTKNLPLFNQLQVKRKIFETVSEAEENTMMSNMVHGQSSSSWVLTSGPPSSVSSGQEDPSLTTYWSDFGSAKNTKFFLSDVYLLKHYLTISCIGYLLFLFYLKSMYVLLATVVHIVFKF